jgi:hypothetical protein
VRRERHDVDEEWIIKNDLRIAGSVVKNKMASSISVILRGFHRQLRSRIVHIHITVGILDFISRSVVI